MNSSYGPNRHFTTPRHNETPKQSRILAKLSAKTDPRRSNKYKYSIYEEEVAQGKLEATDDDLQGLPLVAHVDPLDFVDVTISPTQSTNQRKMESMRKQVTSKRIRRIMKEAEVLAQKEYETRFPKEKKKIKENQEAISTIKSKRSNQYPTTDPIVFNKMMELEPHKLKEEIRKLQNEIHRIRSKNDELENHLVLLSKCRDTLVFEESAAINLRGVKFDSTEYDKRLERARKGYQAAMKRLEGKVIPK